MLVARYTANASGVVPTFNDGYQYTVNETVSNGIYTVEINSDSDFTSCSFNGKSQLLTVEYLKVTSNIVNMTNMFRDCSQLTQLDVSNWDTSNVQYMINTFRSCSSLTQLDVSNWDTSNVTNMSSMFQDCSSLTQLDVSNWDMSNVTSIGSMFYNCSKLTTLDVNNWDTSNVTSMGNIFNNCSSLTQLDLSSWDTKNVKNMGSMFQDCSSLTKLDLSNWDTSNVTNMSIMFDSCSQLTQLDLSNWNTSNVTTMDDMFNNCSQLNKVKLLNTSNNINLINTLPTKTIANVGYLITKEEYPNDKYWENIIIKEKQVDLILPQPLRRVGDVSDRLYWDREKGCYCIEININEDLTIKEESQIIDLSQYVEPILFYQREGTTVKIAENSPIKPKELTLNYRNIDDK